MNAPGVEVCCVRGIVRLRDERRFLVQDMVPVHPLHEVVVPDGGPVGAVCRVQGKEGEDGLHPAGGQSLLSLRPLDVQAEDVVEDEVWGGVVEGRDTRHKLVEAHTYRPPVYPGIMT